MARKKEPKPLLATKHDFVDSLDNVISQAMMFLQSVDQAIDLKVDLGKNTAIADMLRERSAAFRAAIFTEN